MNITEQHVEKFREIVSKYHNNTEFPVKHNWKNRNNNDLWLGLVGQVILVGGSAGNERFLKREDLKQRVSYAALAQIPNDLHRQIEINSVLNEAQARYASKDINK